MTKMTKMSHNVKASGSRTLKAIQAKMHQNLFLGDDSASRPLIDYVPQRMQFVHSAALSCFSELFSEFLRRQKEILSAILFKSRSKIKLKIKYATLFQEISLFYSVNGCIELQLAIILHLDWENLLARTFFRGFK